MRERSRKTSRRRPMSNPLLDLFNRVASIEKRLAGMMRHAPVHEVNASEGWVRLNLGDGDDGPLISPKIPYGQFAGALKVHTPPSVGQNMTMVAPTGDPRQAVALPMTWSNQNESPSGSSAENVVTFGDVRIELTESGVRIEVGGFTLLVSGAGLAMEGGGVGHNGKNIGATHRHSGIERGGSNTDPPNAGGPTP